MTKLRKLLSIFCIGIVVIIILIFIYVINKDGRRQNWFAFPLSARLKADSIFNLSSIVLDKPAGKHGFLKVKGSSFCFEDGTTTKFWGTNLCFAACFPSKTQSELVAERLAFFGFNAVRLHHMDFYFEPAGIFKDTCPGSKNPQLKKTGMLSKKQLDKLDYFIYQLKQRGIYVDMNLLVSRHFTKADGVIQAEKMDLAAKPVSLFDKRLIELQKEYAKELLTHYNPYTKLRYCDDPAIALVEITNENSIFALKWQTIPSYYRKRIRSLLSEWKNITAIGSNKIDKTMFFMELEKKYVDEMLKFLKNEVGIKVPITGIGGCSFDEDVIAQQNSDFIDKHFYWDHPYFPNKPWDRHDFRMHNKSIFAGQPLDIINEIIKFDLGAKPYTITEWNQCYPNPNAYEMPTVLAYYAWKNNWDGLFQFTFADGWIKGPIFDEIYGYFDLMANTQQLILCSLGSLIFLKGFQSSEAGFENGFFKFDSPNIKGAVGFVKDKTISFDKCLSIVPNEDGAVFICSGDNLPIEQSKRLGLVVVSGVKNNKSKWFLKRYFWGRRPVMLKKISIRAKFFLNKRFKVYELGRNGARCKKIKGEYANGEFAFSTQKSETPWFEIVSD